MKMFLPMVCCVLAASAGLAETSGDLSVRSTSLTIGHGWAVVREVRSFNLREGEQEVLLSGIPREADLSSLLIRSRRAPIELLECDRQASAPAAGGDRLVSEGEDARWIPGRTSAAPSRAIGGSGAVACRIKSPMAWNDAGLEVSYFVRGFDWAAHYQVAVRGEQSEEQEPVSVDLSGYVRIENKTDGSFINASIRLAGGHPPEPADVVGPGFLSLDEDSPLADLWREKTREPEPEYEYELRQRASLASHSESDAVLVRTVRTPASRLYSMTAEDFPMAAKETPLRKWIVFQNTPANRLGVALPPGRVEVFLGGTRGKFLQVALFNRTPANGEMRIDLGLADEVRGTRAEGRRSEPVAGYYDQEYLIAIRNQREGDILCEIDEKPPLILAWDVVSASTPYAEAAQRLKFNLAIRANTEEILEYKLRVRQPVL